LRGSDDRGKNKHEGYAGGLHDLLMLTMLGIGIRAANCMHGKPLRCRMRTAALVESTQPCAANSRLII
jgi:hypothetical protein